MSSSSKLSSYDIDVSHWGPFYNNAFGISQTLASGQMVAFIPMCGFVGKYHVFPQTRKQLEDFFIDDALPDLSAYKSRYVISPDGKFTADAVFSTIDNDACVVDVTYENKSDHARAVDTFIAACPVINQPEPKFKSAVDRKLFLSAKDYEEIDYQNAVWQREHRFGLDVDKGAVDGLVLSAFRYDGNYIKWNASKGVPGTVNLRLRYSLESGPVTVTVKCGAKSRKLKLETTGGKFGLSDALKFSVKAGESISVSWQEKMTFVLNGVFLGKTEKLPEIQQTRLRTGFEQPAIDHKNKLLMLYVAGAKRWYGIHSPDLGKERDYVGPYRYAQPLRGLGYSGSEFRTSCERLTMTNIWEHSGNLPDAPWYASGTNPYELQPGRSVTHQYMILSAGSKNGLVKKFAATKRKMAANVRAKKKEMEKFSSSFRGPFSGLIRNLSAQTLTNIGFPESIYGRPVRNYTPAKHYSTFYLWDMGMTGIGMSAVATERAEELLNQYFTGGKNNMPFLEWGTMLPIHIFLYWQIYCANQNPEYLKKHFNNALRMYDFFAGRPETSRMRDAETGLVCNFHYFYNSGGWDDYPAQMWKHKNNIPGIFPVISIAQTIASAKLLRQAAAVLGKKKVMETLSADIAELEGSLEKYHWNGRAGLYSYYDKNTGKPFKIGRHEANHGLDGYYPLVSLSIDRERADAFVGRLMDEKRFLTPFGITTVDKTAPYYDPHGYWNGHVWAAHNWFYWKALLSYGYVSEAREVTSRLLLANQKVFERTGTVFENLQDDHGTGEHVPYFSGLSSPMLDMYAAYFSDKKVTCGYDLTASCSSTRGGGFKVKLQRPCGEERKHGVVVSLGVKGKFRMSQDGVFKKNVTTNADGNCDLVVEFSGTDTELLFEK